LGFAGGNVPENSGDAIMAFVVDVDKRSALEQKVREELDRHEVIYAYEPKNIPLLNGEYSWRYWPDFKIIESDSELELPIYLEVKPQEFIYDLRCDLGVTRKFGERFSGEAFVECDFKKIKSLGSELWKPKRLAEMAKEPASVLVLGGVNRTSSLSVIMTKDGAIFTREQPFVNWEGHLKRLQREVRNKEYEAWQEECRKEREKLSRIQRQQSLEDYRQCEQTGMPTKFDQSCIICGTHVRAGEGHLAKHPIRNRSGRTSFLVCCDSCHQDSGL
jgi:hypothetical protein